MQWLVDRPPLFFVTMLALFVGCTTVGVFARIHGHRLTSAERAEFDLVRNAMFTLLGLIIGFAISMAVNRYDLRKTLEEAEANAIGTEYLRLDFLPPETAAKTRALLRTYAGQRIAYYVVLDTDAMAQNAQETAKTAAALWAAIGPDVAARPTPLAALAASGMNDVLNAYGYTVAAWRNRLPVEVWLLLIAVAAGCNFLIGFGAEKLSSATHAILPIAASLAVLLIADVEGPGNGFVRVHPDNLIDAAASMRAP
ncbi:hypothetical protein DFR50_109187 [Roseiarcus fermentans]|uniref:DUF4239 domain-containing protein n=1 Tax=Roseiarcus fermentans TaxID=1473586 RepID=A0A366FIB9_9HYPH|nr:hypothetical protein [Roseiarcus fermentans]RBP14433.1 hypothetical protein DFR50_109187 [Roseiarcus fermentans]